MGMPQINAFEKLIFEVMEGSRASHSCYRGVANLLQFMAGRINELWNVVSLVALAPSVDRLHGPRFPGSEVSFVWLH
jgi:hypothetical protein